MNKRIYFFEDDNRILMTDNIGKYSREQLLSTMLIPTAQIYNISEIKNTYHLKCNKVIKSMDKAKKV